jgi:hypothetical protein
MEKPMGRVYVQNFYRVSIEEISDPIEIRAVTDKKKVIPGRNESIIVFVDHVHAVSKIQECSSNLPRFPAISVIFRKRLSAFQEKRLVAVAQ